MKNTIHRFCFVFLGFLVACSGKEINNHSLSDDTDLSAMTILNISYGNDEAQIFDLYLPANRSASTTKVLVFIHGGGWVQGDKIDMNNYIPLLQQEHPEHAIVNVNYRLATPGMRAAFPNQFLDIQQALEHLDQYSEDFSILPEFGLIGVSAGGHLALQYDNEYDIEDQVKMVCSIAGPTNLKDPFYSENPDFEIALEHLVDEIAYPGITDYALAVSPAYLVDGNSSATILFYGKDDQLVPVSNGSFLQERLKAAGVDHSFTIYEGGHGDWADEANENMQLQLKDFIDEHLPVGN